MDSTVAALAAQQDGIVSVAQLRTAGLSDRQIAYRARRGRLIRLHAGVFLVSGAPVTLRARVRAALAAAGPGAFASHRTAAVLWGIRRGEPGIVDVTVAADRRLRLRGVRGHRHKNGAPPDTRTRHGLRLSSPGRTICELAATEPRSEVEYAIQEAAANLRFGPEELKRAADAWGARAGRAVLRAILQDEYGGQFTRSWAERELLRIVDQAGLPRPRTNLELLGHRPDAVWFEQRLAVFVDGIATHGTTVAFHHDRIELADFTVAGFRVLRPTGRQLKDEPMRVAVQIARVLGAAGD